MQGKIITHNHQLECLNLVDDIITMLDDESLLELSKSYSSDIDDLLSNIVNESFNVIYTGNSNLDFSAKYTEKISNSIEETLRNSNLSYFITSVLPDFQLAQHHLEWGDLILRYDKLAVIAARDHGKSFYFSNAYAIWKLYQYSKINRKTLNRRPTAASSNRGYLFSFSQQQAADLLEILKNTIEGNDILNERLFPTGKDGNWAATNIVCKNGARLTIKGFGSSVRGAHPYWIVVDDGLKDNVLYSAMQRIKSIQYFHAVIMNMIVPGGQVIVVGTPFHALDLYGDLKSKRSWFVIEYPAIFPDGRVLWSDRWSFKSLMDKKETQGNMIFSRENLCRPIINEASIFPLDVLERSTYKMENYTLVRNRSDFPLKFERVVVGCDFAISGNVAADYIVFSVWGCIKDERWLMHMYREKGKSFSEQIQVLKGINIRFSPDLMILEQNQFQIIFVQEADKQGIPVIGHHTGVEKNDLRDGWPGLAIDFERWKIHIPVGDEYSRNMKDIIFSDLGSVAFTDKGLQSVGEHDDVSSSFWLAKIASNKISTGFKFSFLG